MSHAEAPARSTAGSPTRVVRPEPLASAEIHTRFHRGRVSPRGVVWFGVRSFWGHLRHFVAAAIATEDIDSRDWMNPDDPNVLAARVIEELGGDPSAASVVDALGRDLWIDYIADTGDDVSVSGAVAELLFETYEVPDPDSPGDFVRAPRGDILLFGGDTAYPVATAQEITNRVLVPYNRVIDSRGDGRKRVVLGIPGNHDWYDGLDGFGRMFRRRDEGQAEPRPSRVGISRRMLDNYAEWAREFVRGGKVEKPKALVLSGYVPVQNASYFVLPLTSHIHLFAADRQLKTLDTRQQRFLFDWYHDHADVSPWILLPDPLYQFGHPSRTGTQMVEALGIDFTTRPHFLLSGDVHHYERLHQDNLLHVIAGGGGAFLHPAPVFEGRLPADVRWPTARQSRALLALVPFKIALGRSGFLPHLALGAVFAPAMAVSVTLYERLGFFLAAQLLITVVVGTIYLLIGGVRRNVERVASLAYTSGALTAAIPLIAAFVLTNLLGQLSYQAPDWLVGSAVLVVAVFAGAWVFGAYLASLTRLGLEHTQAFTALDHPGFKHFVRLRVRADGEGIDGWCLGLVDPLREGEKVRLVDRFQWRVRGASDAPRAAADRDASRRPW